MIKKLIVISLIYFAILSVENWKRENGIKVWWWDPLFPQSVPRNTDETITVAYKILWKESGESMFKFLDEKDAICLVKDERQVVKVECESFLNYILIFANS